jgi:mannose/cellobiose epimerase-like protein (N-acyl-D-glucosamine 2-epimerase family)
MNPGKAPVYIFVLLIFCSSCCIHEEDEKYLDGEFWRNQGLENIIPFWQAHARDTVYGAYYLNLTREGTPVEPWDKYPAMISRNVFGFTAAYLLSGEEKYLETAKEGADYLLKIAWDKQYGGWYGLLDQSGYVKDSSKSVPDQLYTNAGLVLYYFATGDENVYKHIRESIRIQKTFSFDKTTGGYSQTLSENLSVLDSSKSKHGHYGYTSSLLINMMMISHEKEFADFAEEQMNISFDRMRDPENGWFLGFPKPYDASWNYEYPKVNNKEIISAGAQLTATLSMLRLYEITGNEKYKTTGLELGNKLNETAWDKNSGAWYDKIERMVPHKIQDTSAVYFWLQSYGLFMQLHLYQVTGDEKYLDSYKKMARFWDKYFIDKDFGGAYLDVSASGVPLSGRKAAPWKASYHEMENSMLNYLYLNLYVTHKPATLFFHLKGKRSNSKHFVSIIENPAVEITGVKLNGMKWDAYDARERSVTLPEEEDIKMEVTFGAVSSTLR